MLILWRISGKKKYEKIIEDVNDPHYKARADVLLTEIV